MSSFDLTFRDVEMGLVDLIRQREEIAERCSFPASGPLFNDEQEAAAVDACKELDACDEAIRAYLKAEVQKVDGVAAYILREEAAAATAKEEYERLLDRRDMHMARAKRVREMALQVMQDTEQRTIEGARHTLKLKKNPPAVVIAQPDLVPDSCNKVTVSMPAETWNAFIEATGMPLSYWRPLISGAKVEPSKSVIASALKAQPCPECKGEELVCLRCNGTRTVKGSVPGCRIESKDRLEVS